MSVNSDISVEDPISDIDGVKPAVATKIAEMLRKGRRYFGSSGASMTYQAFEPSYIEQHKIAKEKAIQYLEGERDTTTILKKWMEDKPNAVLVDSVNVPYWDDENDDDSLVADEETGIIDTGNTDHVLIIGSEVILIDTRRWKKKKGYAVDDDGQALMTNRNFPGGDLTINKSINLWLDYLDEDAFITGFVCINQEEVNVMRNKNWYTQNYRLVELERFNELLDEKWERIEDFDKEHINSTLVSQVVVKAIKPFDQYSKVFDMESLRNFK